MSAQRPTLSSAALNERARAVAEAFVAGLQRGLGAGDAVAYNERFADDVMWGGPFGALIDGFDDLHAIHRRLHAAGAGGDSRYELVRVRAPTPDVVLAHVRRVPNEPRRPGAFAETVLFVLVERDGGWWLAAGHNTPVQPGRSADGT